MKHLIIYAHPNPNSLNSHFKLLLVNALRQHNHEVMVRDLYELNFNPVLSLADIAGQMREQVSEEVKTEQEYITAADCITVIHPIWWTGLPAMMKGYIDKVFSYGFAYRYDQGVQKGLLSGKQLIIVNTHGKSNAEYAVMGMTDALILTSHQGLYSYCGLDMKNHFFFGQADRATPEKIAGWEAQLLQAYDID